METWQTVTAIVLPSIAIMGFVFGQLWNIAKHREAREQIEERTRKAELASAEERGKMEEKRAIMERQIDAAHEKIREINGRHDKLDLKLTELSTDMKHVVKSIDNLTQMHTSERLQ